LATITVLNSGGENCIYNFGICRLKYIPVSLRDNSQYIYMIQGYIQFSPPESCRCIDCYLSRRQVCIIIYRCQSYIYSSLPLNHVDVLTVISCRLKYIPVSLRDNSQYIYMIQGERTVYITLASVDYNTYLSPWEITVNTSTWFRSPPESCRNIDCYLSRRQVCIIIYRCQSYIYSSLPHNSQYFYMTQGERTVYITLASVDLLCCS
jgi:hypothetical protein